MGWTTVLAGIAMAIGPPLAYSDQFVSIIRNKSSAGFSSDVTGVLIFANITRCFYWLGARFQLPLLIQSLLMIVAQFALLYVCLLYRQTISLEGRGIIDPRSHQEIDSHDDADEDTPCPSTPASKVSRPYHFWQWKVFGTYLEVTACLIALHCALYLVLFWLPGYIDILGFVALGSEATLPIPQLLVNYERKSTAGFRYSVLAGWFGGDFIKTIYFFATENNGPAFKICALFQLSIDCLLCAQTYLYREQTRRDLQHRPELSQEPGVAGTRGLYDSQESHGEARV